MQEYAYKKEIGVRLKQLRNGLERKNINGNKFKTATQFIELLNSDEIDYGEYSITDIKIPRKKQYVSKLENGILLPATDYLYLVHKRFNKSLDYFVFGHTLPEIEKFNRIFKRLDNNKQWSLIDRCFELAEDKFKKDRDYDDDKDVFVDYRLRLYEVRKYFCNNQVQGKLTQVQFSKLVGVSKNTMDKYHSKKNDVCSKKYANTRNSALDYLIKFSVTTKCSLDYVLYGTYFDEDYPVELSETLRCYDYKKQMQILKLWLEEAKKFQNFF